MRSEVTGSSYVHIYQRPRDLFYVTVSATLWSFGVLKSLHLISLSFFFWLLLEQIGKHYYFLFTDEKLTSKEIK